MMVVLRLGGPCWLRIRSGALLQRLPRLPASNFTTSYSQCSQQAVNAWTTEVHLRKPVMCRLSQTYALVRSDLDTLLMPLLRQLYHATRRAPSHMYMLLVIVLILSQDTAFAAAVHKVPARPCTHCPCARECA